MRSLEADRFPLRAARRTDANRPRRSSEPQLPERFDNRSTRSFGRFSFAARQIRSKCQKMGAVAIGQAPHWPNPAAQLTCSLADRPAGLREGIMRRYEERRMAVAVKELVFSDDFTVPPSICDLTFDMSGGRKQAQPAGGRPLDGGVRPHSGGARLGIRCEPALYERTRHS